MSQPGRFGSKFRTGQKWDQFTVPPEDNLPKVELRAWEMRREDRTASAATPAGMAFWLLMCLLGVVLVYYPHVKINLLTGELVITERPDYLKKLDLTSA